MRHCGGGVPRYAQPSDHVAMATLAGLKVAEGSRDEEEGGGRREEEERDEKEMYGVFMEYSWRVTRLLG